MAETVVLTSCPAATCEMQFDIGGVVGIAESVAAAADVIVDGAGDDLGALAAADVAAKVGTAVIGGDAAVAVAVASGDAEHACAPVPWAKHAEAAMARIALDVDARTVVVLDSSVVDVAAMAAAGTRLATSAAPASSARASESRLAVRKRYPALQVVSQAQMIGVDHCFGRLQSAATRSERCCCCCYLVNGLRWSSPRRVRAAHPQRAESTRTAKEAEGRS